MKRIDNLFNRIISYENLVRADKKARLGKTKRYGVKKFDRNPYEKSGPVTKGINRRYLSYFGILRIYNHRRSW